MNNHQDLLNSTSNDEPRAPTRSVPFSVSQQLEFTLKELRETLRDRRTIVTLLAMPLLLYPLLGLGLRFLAFQQKSTQKVVYQIAIETEAEVGWLNEALQAADQFKGSSEVAVEEQAAPGVQFLVAKDQSQSYLESMVQQSMADLGIRVQQAPLEPSQAGPPTTRVQLLLNRSSALSREAADYVEKRLAAVNIGLIKQLVSRAGIDLRVPVEQERVLVESAQSGSAVLSFLPLILLLMTVTGGVYPAIDLTAGERERNTLETLMALPVPRFRLLLAKYVAVVTVTMLTGLMNLLAMGATLYALQLDKSLLGSSGFTIGLGIKLFFALAAFALFYSAVLLLLTSSARSFKEAQAYLIPLLLLSIAPGLVILMPGWMLDSGTAALPLVNMLLISRELLQGKVALLPAMVAVVSTILYGMAALALAAQVFGNDAVAVGSRGRWKDFWQRPETASLRPSITMVLVGLAILFPAYFLVSGILSRGEARPVDRLGLSAVMTVVLFVGLPWSLMRWQRVSIVEGLGFKRPSTLFMLAALLLGSATWPWIFELVVFAQSLGIRGIDLSQIENVESLLEGWKAVPLWLVVLCLGVAPGVCEEFFFRGFLFNGLKQHLGAIGTITVSAVAFGLFHVVLAGGAAPERLLPSTLMGLLLGWLAWRSCSILPSMLLHVVHNSTLLVVVQSRDLLAQWNIGQLEQSHLPAAWLAASAAVLVIGFSLARLAKTRLSKVQRDIGNAT